MLKTIFWYMHWYFSSSPNKIHVTTKIQLLILKPETNTLHDHDFKSLKLGISVSVKVHCETKTNSLLDTEK